MPIYEYQCDHCDHKEEKIVKQDEGEHQKCSSCGKETEKLISTCSFKLTEGCGGVHNTKFVG